MNDPATVLNALVETTRDGLDFYTDAVARVQNPQLKALCRELLDAKHELISALSDEVRVRGAAPSRQHTLAGDIHQLYADLRARLGERSDGARIADLESVEERLLAAFEQAARDASDASLRRVVEAHLPRVRDGYARMRDLRLALAA